MTIAGFASFLRPTPPLFAAVTVAAGLILRKKSKHLPERVFLADLLKSFLKLSLSVSPSLYPESHSKLKKKIKKFGG
jgi:hypothetical protein